MLNIKQKVSIKKIHVTKGNMLIDTDDLLQ